MKKLSFFLMAMLFSVMSFAQEAIYTLDGTITGGTSAYAEASSITQDNIAWSVTGNTTMNPWRIGGKSITNQDRAVYSKNPIAYNIDKIELTHGTASSITVNSLKLIISDAANGAGETIDVAFKASATTTIDLPEGDYTNKYFKFLYNVTVSGTSNKYVQFNSAKFYAALAEDAVKAPVIKGAEDFISETEIAIEAEDDVTVYYTVDGIEPTTASTVYTAPFTVKETTTVKAVAYRGEKASFVTSATFTKATQLTCAEAAVEAMKVASNNATTNITYVVYGYVTELDGELSSGQQKFWVSDTKGGENTFYSYFCNVPRALVVGDYIQMFGKLTKYNTTPQMKNGDITILPAPVAKFNVTVTAENGTVEGAGEYEEGAEATLTATAAEGYEFTCWTSGEDTVSTANPYTFAVAANVALVANFNKKAEPEHTYTVAGSSEAAFGTAWDPENADNDMKKQEDGTYKWEKEGLELLAGEVEFKVTEDHAWTVAYPAQNYKLAIAETGIYTLTITFNPADQAVAATATKTGDVVIIPTIAMHGNFLGSWADTENFTLAADEATATLTLTIAEGNYEFGMRIGGSGNWTSNGVAFTRENASAEIVAGAGNLTLAADVAGEYTFTWTYATNTLTVTYPVVSEPEYEIYEVEIKDLAIDLDNLALIGSANGQFQVAVNLFLGEYNRNEDTYQLFPESYVEINGSEATFVEGYASVNTFDQTATAVVRCVWNGMNIELHLNMSAAPLEATVVVVENAVIEIEKVLLFGDMYDYALKMTGEWVNPENGLTYPVLVDVPVYYPESTEPSEITSTVTVGGWGDEDPWLGFGEGTLTITTVDDVITATGVVQNPMLGIAIDITISGTITPSGVENATVTINPVKMIQNGQLIIIKNDVQYNAQGAKL